MSFHPRWSSVQVKCSFECRTGHFPPKLPHNFCLNTRSDDKRVTLFSGNPVFHKIVICTLKMHFWQLRRYFCVKTINFFFKAPNWWNKWKMFENVYEIVLWRRKTQFCQKCSKKVVRSQKFLCSKSENVKKSHVPPRNLFCFQKNSLHN